MIEFVGGFKRGRRAFICKLLIASLVCWNISDRSGKGQTMMSEDEAPPPVNGEQRGVIIVDVRYGEDGKVRTCQILRSNAPLALESSTLDYIRKHWGGAFFAGSSEIVPIVFDDAPTAPYWIGDMASPPNFFSNDEHEHEITLRVTFGHDGWVETCKVILPSGIDLADRETRAWIKVHWHSASYANKTVDAPFVFQQQQVPIKAPVSVALPETPVPAPVEKAQPEIPTPAVRAQ